MRKLIGLSVSFCILDIVEGRVNFDDVEFIIGGTNFRTVSAAVESYGQSCWRSNPTGCQEVLEKLVKNRTAFQPRKYNLPAPSIANTRWIPAEYTFYPVSEERVSITYNYSIGLEGISFTDQDGRVFVQSGFPIVALQAAKS